MRAVLFEDVGSLRIGDYPDPVVQEPTDAIVRVSTAAICGSDLHLLHGRIPGMRQGSVIGHEVVGTIEAVGDQVARFKAGDRVIASFLIGCGRCWFCAHGEFNGCESIAALGYGLFTGDLDGAQAELVRVPVADLNLHAVDAALTDEQVVFAGDILTTAVYIAERARIRHGDVVAVIGAGPVGLFTLMACKAYGPERIYSIDYAEDRLALAESLGAIPVDATKVNPVVELQRVTGERGADVVIECVGQPDAFTTALNAVRAGGAVAVIGVYAELGYDFPLGEIWRRAITIVMGGTCNVQAHWDRALSLVEDGTIDPVPLITHTLPLEEAIKGYQLFESREALKVVLKP
ncbi:MAG: alcohol dehydrogenase catalytic domain-containing protein [Actinobacteria bacterium]|nr:alcohol dehydrogenase catalytic domain-containing protein [Actinomycetota bacterium]